MTIRAALRDSSLLAIVAGSLAAKVALAWLAAETQPVNDEVAYLRIAEALLAGEGYISSFRPPGYPAFLAVCLEAFGTVFAARTLQVLLSVACIPLVYALGLEVADRRSARIAAALFAFDPVLAGFTHLIWSETLFIALFLAGTVVLLHANRSMRPSNWLLAGVCFGVGGLVRPMLLSFLPLLFVLAAWGARSASSSRERWRSAVVCFALLGFGASAVVLPWTVHNWRTHESLILVDTNGPYNFLVGTEPSAYLVDKDDRWSTRWGQVDGRPYRVAVLEDAAGVQDRTLRRARENIAADPQRFLLKSLWEAAHLWTLDNFVLRHLRNGWYGDRAAFWTAPLALGLVGFSGYLYVVGLLGLVALPAAPFRSFAGLALLHATALFGLTYSLSRYSAPLRPLLAVGAAYLVCNWDTVRTRLLAGDSRARWVLAGAIGAALLFSWAHDLPLLLDLWTNEGAGFRFESF